MTFLLVLIFTFLDEVRVLHVPRPVVADGDGTDRAVLGAHLVADSLVDKLNVRVHNHVAQCVSLVDANLLRLLLENSAHHVDALLGGHVLAGGEGDLLTELLGRVFCFHHRDIDTDLSILYLGGGGVLQPGGDECRLGTLVLLAALLVDDVLCDRRMGGFVGVVGGGRVLLTSGGRGGGRVR